jgi:O-antigen/teichoic acid export membrane protein
VTPAAPRDEVEADDLGTKIVRGSAWAALGYGGAQALSFVTMLFLARLLVPEEFGVVAIALALLAVAQVAQESGLGAALIVYRGDLRRAAACVLVFSPIIAVGLYVLFFAAAPVAASFFDEPQLTSVLRVMSLVLVLRGLAVMPSALLERGMVFGRITVAELSAGVAQAIVTLSLAFAGAGVWSLVFGQLALAAVKLVLVWLFVPVRPSPFEARLDTLRELMRYGRHVATANLVNYANVNSKGIVIGRMLGSAQLGYFTIAWRLASLPVNVVGNIVGRGVFPALARVHGDDVRFRRIWVENVQRVALLAIPTAIGVALVAEPLVLALLGNEWEPAIFPVQMLALGGATVSLSSTSGEVFQALHRPKLQALAEVAYLVISVPAIVFGAASNGLDGAALAIFIVNSAFGAVVVAITARLLGVPAAELGAALLPPALGWVLMAASVLLLSSSIDELSAGVELVALVVTGSTVYVLSVAFFARELVTTMWVSLRGARTSG